MKKSVIKFFIRLAIYFAVVAAVIVTCIFTALSPAKYYEYNDDSWDNIVPYQVLEEGSPYNIVLDQHSHTLYSDGQLTVRQNVLWHIAMGYNVVFITDHNNIDNQEDIAALKEEFADTILIMQGMEWTTKRIHLNFLGISEWDFDRFPIVSDPTDQNIIDTIAEVHRQGGVVTVNHYVWSTDKTKPSRQQFLDWGADYIEIVNSDCYVNDYYDAESIAFCEANGLGQITGTDMHAPNYLQVSGNVHGWTLMTTDTFTEEAVMAQLRERNTTVLHSAPGAPSLGDYPDKPGYEIMIAAGKYFKYIYSGNSNVDYHRIGIVALYVIAIFAMTELCRLFYIGLMKVLKLNNL